jgi:hypothetical protein
VDVHADQLASDATGDARGAPDQRVAARRAGEAHHHPLAGLPRVGDAVLGQVGRERLLHPVGDPQQRELAQRAEVADPEVVGQRGVDRSAG